MARFRILGCAGTAEQKRVDEDVLLIEGLHLTFFSEEQYQFIERSAHTFVYSHTLLWRLNKAGMK